MKIKIDWNLEAASAALGIRFPVFMEMLCDGRILNPMVTGWIHSNVRFEVISDGASGKLIVTVQDGKVYRLRVGTDKLSLAPSGAKGMGRKHTTSRQLDEMKRIDGYVVVFTCELPQPFAYFISQETACQMRDLGKFDSHWEGGSAGVRDFLNIANDP